MRCWEYLARSFQLDDTIEQELNALGQAGWEMVTANRAAVPHRTDPGQDVYYNCVFKRPVGR